MTQKNATAESLSTFLDDENALKKSKLVKLEALEKAGILAFPPKFAREHTTQFLQDKYQ